MKQRPKVEVKRSSAGLGLFACEDIKKGTLVTYYTGEKISSEEADRRGGKYLFTVDKKTVIDGKDRTNISRYINHSCKPNCEPVVDEDAHKIEINAIKNITAGEEITYNYGKEYFNEHIKPHGCRCAVCVRRSY